MNDRATPKCQMGLKKVVKEVGQDANDEKIPRFWHLCSQVGDLAPLLIYLGKVAGNGAVVSGGRRTQTVYSPFDDRIYFFFNTEINFSFVKTRLV